MKGFWVTFVLSKHLKVSLLIQGLLKLMQMFFHFWFAANMTNCMTWNMENPEPFLEVDVKLNVALEVVFLSISFFRSFITSFSYGPL